jgi:hypothetical protein
MTSTIYTTGTLSEGQVIKLDEPVTPKTGRVRITLVVDGEPETPQSFLQTLEMIWAGQHKRGHVPPTAEDVAARISDERDSWDN